MIKEKLDIVCGWGISNKFVINPDGQVHPCCYIAKFAYHESFVPEYDNPDLIARSSSDKNCEVLDDYLNYSDELNIFNNPIESILGHNWFKETLVDSWEDETKCSFICKRHCTRKNQVS